MKILVYNIAYGTGSPRSAWQLMAGLGSYLRSPGRYFKTIAHLVRHHQPDVAGFLETDTGSPRTGGVSQVEVLAEILRTRANGGFGTKYAPGGYLEKLPYCRNQTNALMVRDGAAENEWFDYMPCGAKRLVLGCEYESVKILLVHLALRKAVRRKQLDYLAEKIAAGGRYIVCGDFNTFSGHRELLQFMRKTHLRSANKAHLPTYPARKPAKELDYILYSPELQLKSFRVIRFPGSDHLPLLAEFQG